MPWRKSNPPEEVVARGPEALRAYEHSCCEGSISLFRTRIFLIGPPGGNTTLLKWKLVGERLPEVEEDFLGINTHFSCQTVEEKGKTWNIVSSTTEEDIQDVKECLLSTNQSRNGLSAVPNTMNGTLEFSAKRDPWSEDTLEEIPEKVVDLVESLLKEADLKEDWDKKEIEALSNPRINISFNIWEFSEEMFHLLPHQIFATSQAIYIYVLDLNRAVDEPITALTGFSETRPLANLTFTPLSLLHAWLTVLHLTVAQNNKINSNTDGGDLPEEEDGVPALRPPVVIVGMLRKSDNINEERQHITAEEMFVKIRESLRDSPYKHHVVPTCFMLDWRDTEKLEEHMEKLRETVRTLAVNQPQMPVEVPLRWLAFQREISNLLKKGVYMANYCQLYEVAQRQGISKEDEFWAMLNFLHDQGKLSSFPCNLVDKTRDKWEGIAVLSPQWFVNHIYKVFNPSLISNKTEQPKEDQSGSTSVTNGYLSDEYFNSVWSDVAACKQTFIEF
ncbi:uncharacterized protein LOC143233606 [Tachypleus tridentatus]|uniref:uncharacterized protein LOC143233606 n=1 Tax=Tachypleus tridentatus TaxID=6853 RepID=UPI003FD46317